MNRSFLYIALIVLGVAGYAVLGPKFEAKNNADTETASLGDIGGNFSLTDQNGNNVDTKNFDNKYRLVFFGFTNCPDTCPAGLQTMTETLEKLNVVADDVQPMFITVDPERDSPEKMKEFLTHYDSRILGLTGSKEQIQQVAEQFKVFYQKEENKVAQAETAENGVKANENVEKVAVNAAETPKEESKATEVTTGDSPVSKDATTATESAAAPVESTEGSNKEASAQKHADNNDYQVNHSSFFYLLDKNGKLVKHFASNVTAEELAKEIQSSM